MTLEAKKINILGIRGIPAAHGGFETFAEHLAIYLQQRGWEVVVYCQIEPDEHGEVVDDFQDEWNGIHRIHIGTKRKNAIGTMEFDFKCILDVIKRPGKDLILGYNTAIFNLLQRVRGRRIFMNMDGIEWKRDKWSALAKVWFFFNELFGANLCSVAIADHPEIARHVAARTFKKPIMIPYGADEVTEANEQALTSFGIQKDKYLVSIARIEPENSTFELVTAFSQANTDLKCVVLGKLDDTKPYHAKVRAAANENVIFAGAIYDKAKVQALRFFARAYFHGHQVGGTNPSLVEALGAGNAVIAHDNKFNRWTAGDSQLFFSDAAECQALISEISNSDKRLIKARTAAINRHRDEFTWNQILYDYEVLLES